MFKSNSNDSKKNSFVSDNLAAHYDNLKKDLKRANILFPSTKGRDEAEDEIKEWEKRTKQDKKSSDKEWSQFLSLGDSEPSPLLGKSLKEKGNKEEKPLTLKGSVSDTVYSEDKNDEKDKNNLSFKNSKEQGNARFNSRDKHNVNKKYENFSKKIDDFQKNVANGLDEMLHPVRSTIGYAIGKGYNKLSNIANENFGPDTAGQLDLAHGDKMNDRSYIKDVIHLDNYNDPKIRSDREYLKDKVSGQFKDYNFDINKIKGYFFKSDSEPVQRLIKNKDFQNAIKENKDEILKNGKFSFTFPRHGIGIGKDNNFHYAIKNADFKHGYQDEEGNLHIKMYDTYDFNNESNFLIKAGRDQMMKGNLHPYFTVHDIIVPKKELDKIWK